MTDFQTQQRRRNMVVGGFVLLAFAAFVWMLVKFRNLPLFASQLRSFTVLVNFPGTPGVQNDTPVQYCGYQIGRVMSVSPPKLEKDEESGRFYHRVGVSIAIDNKFIDIPDHAEFMIVKRGLGSSYIELVVDSDKPITGYLRADMKPLNGAVSTASEFFPPQVQKKLEDLVDSVTLLSHNTNAIIGDKDNQLNIKKTLENITLATAQANETLQSFRQFASLGTERLDEVSATLDTTLKSFLNLSEVGAEHIEAVALSLDSTLKEFRIVLSKIHSGDGSAAKFINDGRLYENLLDSSKELEMALDQIKKWAADAREKGIRIKW
jgi:phospholipid/cholesterol/gamma-HCH transport system substrate-binding protein